MSVQPWTRDFTTAPVDLVLHCTSSVLKGVVLTRIAKGRRPMQLAQVAVRGHRWFARIEWEGEKFSALLLPLDVHTLEQRL